MRDLGDVISLSFGVVAGALIVFVAGTCEDPYRRPNAEELRGMGREAVRAARVDLARADTVYVRDTLRLTRELVRHDTVLREIRITDTVWVKEYVRSAEATIAACTDALGSCGRKIDALERLNRGFEIQLAAERQANRPQGRFSRFVERGLFASAGFGACELRHALRPP